MKKQKHKTEKKLKSHIKLAKTMVEDALEDADLQINMLLEEIELEIKNEERPEKLILYKAFNILDEIFIRTELIIQMAKNELISNLQDDLEEGIEIGIIKENFIRINEKTVEILDTLKEKIVSEKEGLKDKYCRA